MSFYSQYSAKSIGRILHFLYVYCGLHVAESVTVGEQEIIYNNQKIADVQWKTLRVYGFDVEIPVFIFYGENKNRYKQQQMIRQISAIMELKEMEHNLKSDYVKIYKEVLEQQSNLIKDLQKKNIKHVILEHLFLPHRGLRFYSTYNVKSDKDPSYIIDGRKAYKVVGFAETDEEAYKKCQEINWFVVHEGENEFHNLCVEQQTYPITINEIVINTIEEKMEFINSLHI